MVIIIIFSPYKKYKVLLSKKLSQQKTCVDWSGFIQYMYYFV